MKTFECQVVTINGRTRCVYFNNFRIVGSKPYVSEGCEYQKFEFTLDALKSAFPELEIREKQQET